MKAKGTSQHIILSSFEDEYEETNDPVWAWHAIDFCSTWQRKTGEVLPYPQWVTDYLSLVADAMLKLDDRKSDVGGQISQLIGIRDKAISTSIQTIRDRVIYFKIKSLINQGNERADAITSIAQAFSLNRDVVDNIYRIFAGRG
jgi:hypothetical protein